jgi:signal transduction histidine kinase
MAVLRDTAESQSLRAVLQRLNDAQEDTARRIARELHDEAGQLLTPLHLALHEWARELSALSSPHLQTITGLLDHVEVRLRDLSHELRPTILDDLGLVPALEVLATRLARRKAVRVTVAGSTGGRLPMAIETTLYRVAQEALTNVARHARATAVRLTIARQGRLVQCAVRDDGIGFDVDAIRSRRWHHGLGLMAIRERVESLGGTVQIESAPDRGTTLRVTIPLEAEPFPRE